MNDILTDIRTLVSDRVLPTTVSLPSVKIFSGGIQDGAVFKK